MSEIEFAVPVPVADAGVGRHLQLARFNARRLAPSVPVPDWREGLRRDLEFHALELEFIERDRAQVVAAARLAPEAPAAFAAWFAGLRETGPGQGDPLFPYLAEQATREEMNWFLTQEIAGEAGFDDLVAMTQVKLPMLAKLELARNYWDEMGRGQARAMHGRMLDALAAALHLVPIPQETVPESLALSNLMMGLALNRCYTYHSVGALGVIELTAPDRASMVNAGLKRLGINGRTRQYFALHATLDIKHAEAWNREVLTTLVAEQPDLARPIAEGALLRLRAGARCFERYRHELGLNRLH